MKSTLAIFALLVTAFALRTPAVLPEWPQFLGPHRNGAISDDTLVKSWLRDGLKEQWRIPLGEGYSGLVVAGDRIFTMESRGAEEFVVSLNAGNGKTVWRVRTGASPRNVYGGLGPRVTPCVDGDMLFTVSAEGALLALRIDDGRTVWSRNLVADLGWRPPAEGAASSPLIHNGKVYVLIGGTDGRAVAAFNRNDGKTVWVSQDDRPSYSSPVYWRHAGKDQVLFLTGSLLFSVDAEAGRLLWKYSWPTYDYVNVATPLIVPPDRVFISSGYDQGAALLRPTMNRDGSWNVQEMWRNREMKNHFNNSVYHNGAIFGFDNSVLKAIDLSNGQTLWREKGFGKGSLILVGSHLIVLSETGELLLARASKERFSVERRIAVLKGRNWTPPSVAGTAVFLRNQQEAVCLSAS